MRFADYPDNWEATIDHMMRHRNAFRADAFEKAAEIARGVGDDIRSDELMAIAAECAVRDLEIWDHMLKW